MASPCLVQSLRKQKDLSVDSLLLPFGASVKQSQLTLLKPAHPAHTGQAWSRLAVLGDPCTHRHTSFVGCDFSPFLLLAVTHWSTQRHSQSPLSPKESIAGF